MEAGRFSGVVLGRQEAAALAASLRSQGRRVVFTNGCFDILHTGHVTYLEFARRQGDALFVGLNSDASVRRAKGPGRPVNCQEDRARVLAALRSVDCVTIFDEDEPRELIAQILPDVLVKGRDWAHYVSGRDIVEARGGRVVLADLVEGRSTTRTIQAIQAIEAAGVVPPVSSGDTPNEAGRIS
jgi:D-beta-D-heptose 7-phosphate kinase/D-beta-D-heptose 1-phosphate adenosyltransferase